MTGARSHRPHLPGRRQRADRRELLALKQAQGEQRHRLRKALIDGAIVALIIVGLTQLHSQFSGVDHFLSHASPGPLVLGVGLELCSELGFVAAFLLVMDPDGNVFSRRRLTRQIAWTQLGAGMLLPAGAAGGPAVVAWALNKVGMSGEEIAKRSLVLLFLNSAVNFAAVIFFGVTLYLGVLSGSTNPILTILPAVIAALAMIAVSLVPHVLLPLARHWAPSHRRLAVVLHTVAGGVSATAAKLRAGDRRLVGPLAYWAFDNAVLYIVFVALAHPPPVAVVAMAYLVGALGGSIPVPAGLGSLAGIDAALIAFGVPAAQATAAVLVYQAISVGVPVIVGAVAYFFVRRALKHPELLATAKA